MTPSQGEAYEGVGRRMEAKGKLRGVGGGGENSWLLACGQLWGSYGSKGMLRAVAYWSMGSHGSKGVPREAKQTKQKFHADICAYT
jgi:hypothetical protein